MRRLVVLAVALLGVAAGALYLLWPRQRADLVLYSAVDYGPAVARAFRKETGVHVEVVDLSTGALLAKVSAEGRRPAWSMVWFDGDLAATALDQAGLLAKHAAPDLPFTKLGMSLVPPDGGYTPTGLTLAGAFTWRPAELAAPPVTWSDLGSAALKGGVGMNNPSISGPTYPILAGMLDQAGGWPQGENYVLGLVRNGLHVYPKNSNTLAALRSGAIKLAVTQSSAAWYVAAKAPTVKVAIPRPSFALPSVIAVAPGLSRSQFLEAERFIRFAMSPQAQAIRMRQGDADAYYWPITTDTPPRSDMPTLSSLQVKRLDPEKWGPLEPAINAWFSKATTQ